MMFATQMDDLSSCTRFEIGQDQKVVMLDAFVAPFQPAWPLLAIQLGLLVGFSPHTPRSGVVLAEGCTATAMQ